ncbi:holo-ACP synthase [Heyndrickxia acidiproducens]|jgi:holo-[acyl-carrier protein] synthase|uniref:holo-ACP synthase n=1 Tax=Heyndrickxia acidiproducens TaxID=1121084 RepID=UPI00037DBDB6|nr:holo-ACP synthase [Heyndrickxia acidiproducens]
MIKGIGIDIVELERMKKIYERQPRFPKRVLTDAEYKTFNSLIGQRKIEFLSGRFAAKEAFSKALGTGIGSECSFQDIEIEKDGKGRPYFSKPAGEAFHLSITHSREYAFAQVIIEA